jgi:hypothetical protein
MSKLWHSSIYWCWNRCWSGLNRFTPSWGKSVYRLYSRVIDIITVANQIWDTFIYWYSNELSIQFIDPWRNNTQVINLYMWLLIYETQCDTRYLLIRIRFNIVVNIMIEQIELYHHPLVLIDIQRIIWDYTPGYVLVWLVTTMWISSSCSIRSKTRDKAPLYDTIENSQLSNHQNYWNRYIHPFTW